MPGRQQSGGGVVHPITSMLEPSEVSISVAVTFVESHIHSKLALWSHSVFAGNGSAARVTPLSSCKSRVSSSPIVRLSAIGRSMIVFPLLANLLDLGVGTFQQLFFYPVGNLQIHHLSP